MARKKAKKATGKKIAGEPASEGARLHLWQQHRGGCGSWNTRAMGTRRDASEPGQPEQVVITRQRRCLDCGVPYAHVTVYKRGPHGWTETGSGFKESAPAEGESKADADTPPDPSPSAP